MEENQGTCGTTETTDTTTGSVYGSYDITTGEPTSTTTDGTTTSTTDGTCGTTTSTTKKSCDQALPTKVSGWSKLRKILSYEITVELTPYQEKVFQEVGDFWRQEITWKSFKEFWLQDIEITL